MSCKKKQGALKIPKYIHFGRIYSTEHDSVIWGSVCFSNVRNS